MGNGKEKGRGDRNGGEEGRERIGEMGREWENVEKGKKEEKGRKKRDREATPPGSCLYPLL